MLKRFLTLALAWALAALSFAGAAEAQTNRQIWRVQPIKFQTSRLAPDGTSIAVLDSNSFCTIGTQLTYDTTAAIPTFDWELPRDAIVQGVVDTLSWFNLRLKGEFSGERAISGFDSILVQTQVSVDGATWVTATPTRSFDATRATGQAHMATIANPGTNSWAMVPFRASDGLAGIVGPFTTTTDKTFYGWPLVRFILNTAGGDGCFTGDIVYLSGEE